MLWAVIGLAALLLVVLTVQSLGAAMKIRILLTLATAAALAASLGACNSLPGTGGANFDLNAFLNSTTCAHDDEVQGVTGAAGIPASLQFKAARHCPAVPPAVSVGQVVGEPIR